MLLDLVKAHPFEAPRLARLSRLEAVFRRSSEGTITLDEYSNLLRSAGLRLPTERTLYEDINRYTQFCDDLIYGKRAKTLAIDPTASRDAIAWMLGVPWLDSPLRPRLSSAQLRCLLLAMRQRTEVRFQYRPLRKPGEPWIPSFLRGIPLRTIPGIDSGYIQLWVADGSLMNLNLARFEESPVSFTGVDASAYSPIRPEQTVAIRIATEDVHLQERLLKQFKRLRKQDRNTVILNIDESLVLMALDVLSSHLQRTGVETRQPKTRQVIGNTEVHCLIPKEPE